MVKPIVKYQGGKSREIKFIKEIMSPSYNRIIEPFCGGAAVSFHFGVPALLTDVNWQVINLYGVVASPGYEDLQRFVDQVKTFDHDQLEKLFYHSREIINNSKDYGLFDNATAYIAVRQLCFSGMERYSSKGEFNVPFGHYKRFACNLSEEHHKFLLKCKISHASFEQCFKNETENDFIFIDPPYLDRLGYTTGDGGLNLHEELLGCLKATNAKWMIVHSDHEFYRDNYKDYNIMTKDFLYAQRFGKNKDHSGASVQHLYITNYDAVPVTEVAQQTQNALVDALY
jgi:DNA adenine methylase